MFSYYVSHFNAKEYGKALAVVISGIMNGRLDKNTKPCIPI